MQRGRETAKCGCLSSAPTGDLAHNPGMCPDWESIPGLFGSQAGAQSTEPHQPGWLFVCLFVFNATPCEDLYVQTRLCSLQLLL